MHLRYILLISMLYLCGLSGLPPTDAAPTEAGNPMPLQNTADHFRQSEQYLGMAETWGVALGDLNGDTHLDAFFVNKGGQPDAVWLNDGNGRLRDSGQSLTGPDGEAVVLGDIDGDHDLDAIVASNPVVVWLGDGKGGFTDSGQRLGTANYVAVALGDLDGDQDLDLVLGAWCGPSEIWLNNGQGSFTTSNQQLGNSCTRAVPLADLDGDRDLDLLNLSSGSAPRIWLNDGHGRLSDSGQTFATADSRYAVLGDLDGDGDVDAFVVNGSNQADTVWLNDGRASFHDSGQRLGTASGYSAALGDVDGDGSMDALVGNLGSGNEVWRNDGSGQFVLGQGGMGIARSFAVALGDLDHDGDLDAVAGNGSANEVWLNTRLPGPATAIISGQIVDMTNHPIAGVTVRTDSGQLAITDSSGAYQLTGLAAGTYTMRAQASGRTFLPAARRSEILLNRPQQNFIAASDGSSYSPLVIPVHVVQVADDNGQHMAEITPAQFQEWVAKANDVYAVANLRFSFTPESSGPDWSTVQSSLINGMTGVSDVNWAAERDAANAIAAQHPEKLYVFVRYGPGANPTGGGFSWTDYNFIAAPGFPSSWSCGHQGFSLVAHEMGHYFGLGHTHGPTFASIAEAEQYLQAHGNNVAVFDGDGISDTPPDPFIGLPETQCSARQVTLNGTVIPLPRTNIMSYYDGNGDLEKNVLTPQQVQRVRTLVQQRGLGVREPSVATVYVPLLIR